jgi:hypothetical protein
MRCSREKDIFTHVIFTSTCKRLGKFSRRSQEVLKILENIYKSFATYT